jgi:hypothetical protein
MFRPKSTVIAAPRLYSAGHYVGPFYWPAMAPMKVMAPGLLRSRLGDSPEDTNAVAVAQRPERRGAGRSPALRVVSEQRCVPESRGLAPSPNPLPPEEEGLIALWFAKPG